jgi:hypothetical protein
MSPNEIYLCNTPHASASNGQRIDSEDCHDDLGEADKAGRTVPEVRGKRSLAPPVRFAGVQQICVDLRQMWQFVGAYESGGCIRAW